MATNDLVTLAEAKGALKIEGNPEDDVRLSLLIGAASASILRYLRSTGEEYRDSNGNIVAGNVEDDIKQATIMLVGLMDRNPDGDDSKIFRSDYLPAPIEAILHSRRDPALA